MVSDDRHTESITFAEAGVVFNVHPVSTRHGGFLVLATTERGTEEVCLTDGFDTACDEIDRWLDKNLAHGDPQRFQGFHLTVFCHEDHVVRERTHATRGALLKWFDDGFTPTLDDVVELAEFAGDHLLMVRDNVGNVLIDRRELVRGKLEEVSRDSGYMCILGDLSEHESLNVQVPGR